MVPIFIELRENTMKITTVEELRNRAHKLSVGEINAALRPVGVRIGYDRGGQEWFSDFCRDHPEFKSGQSGSRSFQETKIDAIDDALHQAAWYRRYVAFVSDQKAA